MGFPRAKWVSWASGLAVAAVLLSGAPASGQSLYRTKRVLEQKDNACLGASACLTYQSDPISIDAGSDRMISLRCPGDHPYFLGWDATRQEHIVLSVVTTDAHGLKLVVASNADETGSATVFLGCSGQPVRATSYLQSVGSVPTNRRAVIRNAP